MRTQGVISLICSCITAKYCPQYKYLICQPPAPRSKHSYKENLVYFGLGLKVGPLLCGSCNEVDLHLKPKLYRFPKATKLVSLIFI